MKTLQEANTDVYVLFTQAMAHGGGRDMANVKHYINPVTG